MSLVVRRLPLLSLLLVAAACGNEPAPPGTDFVVDNPNGEPNIGSSTAATTDATGGDTGGDGGREVSEADIVQLEGDRLYALSAYAGLSVIDASDPDRLAVLGRFRAHAQPFEMYVDGAQVFMMLSDYGDYDWDEEAQAYTWQSSSRLVALDASDPANVELRGEFELPGAIQDSRRVGDVLYLVTYEDVECWGCAGQPRTVVTSLDVSDPGDVHVVDTVAFVDPQDEPWDWGGARSVSSTDERMYVAGIEYTDWNAGHSTIDVIDISDPGGVMHAGAQVEIAGMIQSRWQLDEYEGILRVVSQPGLWNSDWPPRIETFTVASADEITPLGSLTMTVPSSEQLQTVRFDGPHAYAITFEQTDPLFTLDLTDPANPLQVGALEIPGWIYHMEPRGDRMLALGFDQTNPQGSINVSLFDLADFAAPQLLSRASFGGDWADFGEDQNRVHKAFEILDDLGLLLVPYSGWKYDGSIEGCGAWQSAIQLVDWADDALTVRGAAPAHGRARRALLHRERVLGVSDQALESFDISNRDLPTRTTTVALASTATSLGVGTNLLARLSLDWWTDEVSLELVDAADPEAAEPLGRVSLEPLAQPSPECYDPGFYGAELFVHGGWVYLLRELYDGDGRSSALDVFDVRDPASPTWVTTLDLPFARSSEIGAGIGTEDRDAVLIGDALVIARSDRIYDVENFVRAEGAFEIVDLGEPASPVHVATLARPDALAHGGLQPFGGELVSWHMRSASPDHRQVRFYLDRLEVSDPTSPSLHTPINVPGQPVAYDGERQHAIMVDADVYEMAMTELECWSQPKVDGYDYDTGMCRLADRRLHLAALDGNEAFVLDTLDPEGDDGRLVDVAASASRLFVHVRRGQFWYGGVDDAAVRDDPDEVPSDEIVVVSPASADELVAESTLAITHEVGPWIGALQAADTRVVASTGTGLAIVDASDATAPSVEVAPLFGYGCWDLEVANGQAYCAMGEYGVQAVALD